jgi:hypothetical protein
MEHTSTGKNIHARLTRNPTDGSVTVVGRVTFFDEQTPVLIEWIAAAPTTRGISFAGSGQPYPTRHIALEGTPNKGKYESPDGSFTLHLTDIPAGYYSGLGTTYIPPCIEFTVTNRQAPAQVAKTTLFVADTAAPYRWLNGSPATMRYDPNTADSTGRAMYYAGREDFPIPVNQEALLRAKAYPGDMTARGWPEADDAKPWATTPAPA